MLPSSRLDDTRSTRHASAKPCIVLALVVGACGPQVVLPPDASDSTGTDTVASTTSTGTSPPATSTSAGTGPMTSTSGPIETTTGVEPETTTTVEPETTTDVFTTEASSSDGDPCSPSDQCVEDDDCLLGAMCIACLCLGGCEPSGSGNWGACLLADGTSDTTVCRDDDAVCLVDAADVPTLGVCVPDCLGPCDCPSFPGADQQLRCDDITGDGVGDCFLDCSRGQACPDAMICVAELVCMWPPA